MKKFIFACAIAALVMGGCKCTNECKDNGKPVAPETYQEGQSNQSDPQLPKQLPWWKGGTK